MKRILGICMILLFLISSKVHAEDFKVEANQAIAIETINGKILYEKNAQDSVPVSTLSKVLTIYMVYDAVKSGKLNWNTPVTISDYPYELTVNYNISNVPLDARKYTVKELLDTILVMNANSPAIALAEKIGGTERRFVDLAKEKLLNWGIRDANLYNATGLNNSELGDHIYPGSSNNDENKMSARDLAIICYHLIKDFPEVLETTQKTSLNFNGMVLNTHNLMLKNQSYYREDVSGLISSYNSDGTTSFIATSQENKILVITVVIGVKSSDQDQFPHFTETNRLLQYILENYKRTIVLKKGKAIPNTKINIQDGKSKNQALASQSDLIAIEQVNSNSNPTFKTQLNTKTIVAPFRKGKVVGKATLETNSKIEKSYLFSKPNVNLITTKSVKSNFIFSVWWNKFVRYVNNNL
ncbi:D-alanyl-D-alanine carboxypeptidase PBP3 [Streptococcus urinalis]|nr:D-alanyl-D-alanine carboxypeptidase PBP3 [Streptococcus urinalis]